MSNSWPAIRRLIASEMDLWGGAMNGSLAPATFSSLDPNGSLFIVYDVNRPETDTEWNGAYICINPGASGNANLSTIWRRLADDNGFISSTGAMTLTASLPQVTAATLSAQTGTTAITSITVTALQYALSNGDTLTLKSGATTQTVTVNNAAGYASGYTGAVTVNSFTPTINFPIGTTVTDSTSPYAMTTMTYELFKTFKPEQWVNAANYATREAYPQRHRLLAFEVPEDPNTVLYDWGHLASALAITDPVSAPTVTAVADPGGQTNTWNPGGSYTFAYNIWNAAGETLISGKTTVTVGSGQIVQFADITVPEQAIGVHYWCTEDPSGTVLSKFSVGAGILTNGNTPVDNVTPVPGYANPSNFTVPSIQFWGPPGRSSRTNPVVNTTSLDNASMSLKSIKRRVNPGQFPEHYIDLNPDWWRGIGGTNVKLEIRPIGTYNLRFECIAPVRPISAESDVSEEPLELLISGAMVYLWNQLMMNASAQNVQAWQAEAKVADVRYTKARNYYAMERPRSTIRRPRITIARWWGNEF